MCALPIYLLERAPITVHVVETRDFVSIESPEGSSFNYMDGYARQLEQIVGKEMDKGDIERMLIRVPGQGGADLRTGDVNSARGIVILKQIGRASCRESV